MSTTLTGRRTMSDWAEEHFYRRTDEVKRSTIDSEKSTVRKLTDWCEANRVAPAALDAKAFDDFLRGRDGLRVSRKVRGEELRNNSYNKQLDHLKPFVEWLIVQDVVDSKLLFALKKAHRTGGGRKKTRLSHAQIQDAVENAPDPFERWCTAFASLSMGREGELQATKLSDFNLETRRIAWERPKVDDFDDGLPMMEELVNEYERWRAYYTEVCPEVTGDAYVLPSRIRAGRGAKWVYRSHMPVNRLGAIVKRNYARALGVSMASLPGQAAHMARRSGARVLYDRLRDTGVYEPLAIVQAMLGHEKRETTELYIGLELERQRRDDILLGVAFGLMNWTSSNVVELRAVSNGSTSH